MTDSELRNIYRVACEGKGFVGNEGQFKLWKQTLGWCAEKHLAQAMVWWFEDNQGFPMPADLKPLAERAMREERAGSANANWYFCWVCPCCGVRKGGFYAEDASTERRCTSPYEPKGKRQGFLPAGQVCGAKMDLFSKEDAREWRSQRRA